MYHNKLLYKIECSAYCLSTDNGSKFFSSARHTLIALPYPLVSKRLDQSSPHLQLSISSSTNEQFALKLLKGQINTGHTDFDASDTVDP